MSKKQVSEQLRKEAGAMIEITTPCISKMMQNNTLTVEKVEILSLQMAAKHGFCAMMECLLTTGEAHINPTGVINILHSRQSHQDRTA